MLIIQCITAILAILSTQIEGAKILGIFWTPGKSHHMAGSPLLMELARRGHDVHLISSFNDKNVDIPTYKQDLLTGIVGEFDIFMNSNISMIRHISEIWSLNKKLVARFWQNKPIQELIKNRPKYDVVVVLAFFNDYTLSIGKLLDAPVIVFSAMGTNAINSQFVANPNLPYESTKALNNYFGNLLDRFRIVTFNSLFHVISKYIVHPIQEKASHEYLPEMPNMNELINNVSLVLVNSHFTLEPSRPYVPNMILIGGYYMQNVKPLPPNLKHFLDSATEGAILFSMGSALKIENSFRKDQKEAILKVFSKLAPMKIVFKSEIDFPVVPKNVMISNWLPQNDVLAHPNIKLFISHCGRGGLTEAVTHGVPILGIPFFADQNENVDFASEAGFAIKLKPKDLTQETFDSTLKELLSNPKYAANVKKRSSILREQPIKPMDNAIWWVEHIIEHKGGEHLRNTAMDLAWYQLYMVDIMLFCLVFSSICLCVFFFTSRWLLRKIYRSFCSSKLNKEAVHKKKTN
ncbi:hypothetical protein WA026_013614 [Henosepilachna vigintioctopunctata]|uniref:UDP-glucuronosyltransferase n=1 Tax=Henosepilachna vigintioctopunctata TaxID=420089 RepID=A0AAW1VEI2_9CUCU